MNVNPNNNAPPENVQQNPEANLSQVQPDPNLSQQQAQESPAEDPNWKAVREARKQERKDREAAEKRAKEKAEEAEALKAALEAVLNKPQPNQQQPFYNQSGYQQEETEEQRIDRKVNETLAKKEAEYEQLRRQREAQEYPQRLQREHADFNQIVSEENLDYLEYHYPEVAGPLKRAQEGYDKWSDIYKAVRRFVPNTNTKKDVAKAESNFNKPKSMSTVQVTERGDSPFPTRISEEKKAANWERMQRERYKAT